MDLNGKIMLITGASSGIGAATARAAARAGAKVVLLARTKSKLENVADSIRKEGGTAHVYPVDLTVAEAVAEIAKRVTAEIGLPDIIFNNAGAGKWLYAQETEPADAVSMMASPYFAAFFVTRAFLPDMLKRKSGYIINMTSAASRLVWPGATAYIAARWAIHGFTEALRADLSWHWHPGNAHIVCEGGKLLLGKQSWQRRTNPEGPVDDASLDAGRSGCRHRQRDQTK